MPWLDVRNPSNEGGQEMLRLFIAIAAMATLIAAPALAKKDPAATIKLFDTDNDGTVDLAEAKAAAGALFDKLNKDKDNTVDTKELQGRLSKVDLAAADPDKDGTLTKDEYLAVVEARFKAADPDNDGTLDAKEISSTAGKALVRLLK
jgi:Ca2+-binding EF-hand superfamily protein